MRISTKGRYAIQFLLDLAVNGSDKPESVKTVATRLQLSEKYLEQIASILQRANLIKSVLGSKGGYVVNGSYEGITVGQVLRTTEGSLTLVDSAGESLTVCEGKIPSVTARVWQQLDDSINHVVDNITLQDLVDWYHETGEMKKVI